MEAAQAAIARHTSRRGHFTEVDEIVRPAVTSETIKPHRHEITTEAVEREVHRHHYHTTVQPLSHTETLPARHTHNLLPLKKTEFVHEDAEENKRKLAEFAALFKNISITHPTTHSTEHKPQVVGEHVHHHVHETVQPIIYKETHQRETVHTTIPIHETHHQKAIHHGLSAMPLKTMEDFITFHKDRKIDEVRHSHHEGAPREYDSKLATTFEKLGIHTPHHNETVPTNVKASHLTPISTSHTTAAPTTTTTTKLAALTTPTRHSGRHSHHRSGSDSSASSASDSLPSTPTSPRYRNEMLPKGNMMNKMSLNEGTMTSPTHVTDTYTPTTHINTQTNTTSSVNRVPLKTTNANGPVRIANVDGETSPRYSSDEANPRRSFMGRLSGSSRRAY